MTEDALHAALVILTDEVKASREDLTGARTDIQNTRADIADLRTEMRVGYNRNEQRISALEKHCEQEHGDRWALRQNVVAWCALCVALIAGIVLPVVFHW